MAMVQMEGEPKDGLVNSKIATPAASSTSFELPGCARFDKQSHDFCLGTVHTQQMCIQAWSKENMSNFGLGV